MTKKLRVLVVEDAVTIRNFIKNGFSRDHEDMDVDEAANGKEALIMLAKRHYDMVVCDWEMPLMSGIELLTWVRRSGKNANTPFLMATSKSDRTSVIAALKAGANGYIVKPFSIDSLLHRMAGIDPRFDRRKHERFARPGKVSLHFDGSTTEGDLIDISLGGLFAIFPRALDYPVLLQMSQAAVMDETGQTVIDLTGFVTRKQAAVASLDTEHVKIAVKYTELDDACLNALQEFVEIEPGVAQF